MEHNIDLEIPAFLRKEHSGIPEDVITDLPSEQDWIMPSPAFKPVLKAVRLGCHDRSSIREQVGPAFTMNEIVAALDDLQRGGYIQWDGQWLPLDDSGHL